MIGSRGAQNATRTGSIKALEENVEQVGQNEIQEDTGRVLMEHTMVRDQRLTNKNIADTSREGESRIRESDTNSLVVSLLAQMKAMRAQLESQSQQLKKAEEEARAMKRVADTNKEMISSLLDNDDATETGRFAKRPRRQDEDRSQDEIWFEGINGSDTESQGPRPWTRVSSENQGEHRRYKRTRSEALTGQGRPRATNFRQYNNRLKEYDGSTDYEIWWIDSLGYFRQFENISEEDKVKLLFAAIVGNAKLVLESGGQTFTTAAQINEKMTRSFVSKISWFSKLTTTLQKPGESVDEFHVRLRVLVTRAFGHCGMDAQEMDNYVRDLLRSNTLPEISSKLKISTHSTLQDTLYSAAL